MTDQEYAEIIIRKPGEEVKYFKVDQIELEQTVPKGWQDGVVDRPGALIPPPPWYNITITGRALPIDGQIGTYRITESGTDGKNK
jgi:hypothetical protein